MQENVHKLEIPIALHTQSLTALQPKVDSLSTELKEVERNFVSQLTCKLKSSNSALETSLTNKMKENEAAVQSKIEKFVELQKQTQEEMTSNVNQVM